MPLHYPRVLAPASYIRRVGSAVREAARRRMIVPRPKRGEVYFDFDRAAQASAIDVPIRCSNNLRTHGDGGFNLSCVCVSSPKEKSVAALLCLEQAPFAGDIFELAQPVIDELKIRAGDQVFDRAGQHHLIGLCHGGDLRRDIHRNSM